jgi:hypothetical protein
MQASEIITKGEDLFLPCPDPVVTKVRGYRRFLVGLDIAQSIDQNAFAIIEDVREPAWGEYAQYLKPRTRTIVRAERIPQMDYTRLAQVVKNLMADPALAGRAYLVVDAGGPGRSFCDLLNARGVMHTRMQIVGGDNENETKERATTFWNVGKNMLLGNMNSALHTGDLRIGDFPGRDDLRHELESFEMTMTDAGRVRIEGGTKAGHADIAMAAAMSFALSDHRSVGAFIGETRLRGYW